MRSCEIACISTKKPWNREFTRKNREYRENPRKPRVTAKPWVLLRKSATIREYYRDIPTKTVKSHESLRVTAETPSNHETTSIPAQTGSIPAKTASIPAKMRELPRNRVQRRKPRVYPMYRKYDDVVIKQVLQKISPKKCTENQTDRPPQ